MKFASITSCCAFALAVSGALSSAQAQDRIAYDNSESFTVEAPHLTRENLGRTPGSALPRQRVSYNIPVDVSDLDFARRADRIRLEYRIRDAAWEACRQLDRHYPASLYVPETSQTRSQCAERATENGMIQARQIAYARAVR